MANYNLDNFEKLCYRAKELIFNSLDENYDVNYIYICGINEDIPKLSPIEQIIYVANNINSLLNSNKYIELSVQEEIMCGEKKYIADFVIDYLYVDLEKNPIKEVWLSKPIIIELDGQEYHSSKKQREYDYIRENDLKLNGYDIIRFTGSQVYKNPFECLDKVYEYIKKAKKETK